MPRFYFDVTGDHDFTDEEGVDFADEGTMRREVMRAAGTMLGELRDFPHVPWSMVIRDGKRETVATLTFAASLAG